MALISDADVFSTNQAITSTAACSNKRAIGANAFGGSTRDFVSGTNQPLFIEVLVGTAFTAAGAATLTITLESADSEANFDSATSCNTHYTTAAIAKTALTAGARILIPVPSDPNRYKQVIGLRFTVATGPMTAGTVSAHFARGTTQFFHYPDNLIVV